MADHFDVNAVRGLFPVTTRMLYLDSAHQTPLATPVRDALLEFYREGHESGGPKTAWLRRAEAVRAQAAQLLNASASEIAFTKNTSEGLNIAANAIPLKAGDNVLMIEGDHPNNAYAWLNLKRKGVEVRFVRLARDGNGDHMVADAASFAPHIDARTRVITLSHVTFHAGQRHDLTSIGKLCAEHGIYLVVDAMQSVGVLPLDMKALNVSILAAGCHKGLLVPHGLGILYVKAGLDELHPAYLAMAGVAHPPSDYIAKSDDLALASGAARFELGNLNLPDLHALAASLKLIAEVGVANVEKHVLALGDRLIAHLDELSIALVGPRARSQRAHIYLLELPVDEWQQYFTQSHVRVSPERGGIRISFGMFNTIEDVDRVVDLIRHRQSAGIPGKVSLTAKAD